MSTTTPSAAPGMSGPVDVSQRSFGELLGEVTEDLSTLVRQEIELAKAELRQEATKAGKAASMFAGAGVAAHMTLLFLSIALWWGLSNVMDGSWAALIVAVLWAVIGFALSIGARTQARRMRGLPRTVETVKDIPAAMKPHEGVHQ